MSLTFSVLEYKSVRLLTLRLDNVTFLFGSLITSNVLDEESIISPNFVKRVLVFGLSREDAKSSTTIILSLQLYKAVCIASFNSLLLIFFL